mmetsp:Transcript_76507/g.221102  ORF Transcript_76507/g.221102 Transcript_76507/m.221102 type:complete len:206 (+) Transcript_76507:1045-1662(+)
MKTMHGACFRASWNKSRIRLAPTPTNISSNSEPEACKKGTPASPAIALANRVLPVPGGPDIITPLGSFAPRFVKRPGSFRYKMISCSSSFTSSQPLTSLKQVVTSCTGMTFFEPMPKPFWTLPARPSANTDRAASMMSVVTADRINFHAIHCCSLAIFTGSGSVVGSLSSTDKGWELPRSPAPEAAAAWRPISAQFLRRIKSKSI